MHCNEFHYCNADALLNLTHVGAPLRVARDAAALGAIIVWSVLARRPASLQMLALVAVTALPLILAALLMFEQLRYNHDARLRENLMLRARSLAALVQKEVDTHVAVGWALASSSALKRDDLVSFRTEATEAMRFLSGEWIRMNRPDGRIVLSTLKPLGTPFPTVADPHVVRRALETHEAQIVDLTLGSFSGKWRPYVVVPAYRDDIPIFSIFVAMTPSRFLGLLKTRVGPDELVAIVDRNKRYIARIPGEEKFVGRLAGEGWRDAMAGASEARTRSTPGGPYRV